MTCSNGTTICSHSGTSEMLLAASSDCLGTPGAPVGLILHQMCLFADSFMWTAPEDGLLPNSAAATQGGGGGRGVFTSKRGWQPPLHWQPSFADFADFFC